MSRKRRKNKKRKGSDSDDYEQLSFVCRCQRKPFIQKIDMDSKDVKVDKVNDKSHSCNSTETQTENSEGYGQGFRHKSDDAKTTSCPSPSDKPENFVKVILEDNSTVLQSDRNDLHYSPEKQTDTGEFTAQVTSEGVHLNLEINKLLAPNSRTHVVITNGKCLKKSRSYHDSQHQHSQYHADHTWDFATDFGKDDISAPKDQNSNKPLIKLEIIGEGIEVRYEAVHQNLMVHIESDNVKNEEKDVFGSGFTQTTDFRSTVGSCSSYPVSDYSASERKAFCTTYRCPEWCVDVPPPAEFADEKGVFPDMNIADEALLPEEPYSPVSSSCSELETETRGLKNEACQRETASKSDESHPSQSFRNWKKYSNEHVKTNKTSFNHVPFISNRELKLNQSNCCHWRKSDCPLGTKVMRRKTFPEMFFDPFVNVSDVRQPIFGTEKYSVPRKPHSVAHEIQAHSPTDEYRESMRSSPCKDYTNSNKDQMENKPILPERKKSISYFLQGDCNSSQKDIPAKCVSTDRCSLYSLQQQADVDPTHVDEDDLEDLIKNADERIEYTESGFDEDMLDSDNHTEVQDISELQSKSFLFQVTPPSRTTSREYILVKNSSSRVPAECLLQSDLQTKVLYQSNGIDTENTTRRRRGSVVTVVTGDLDQRVLIQSDNDATASRVQREPLKDYMSSMVHRDSVLTPVSDVEEPDGEKIQSSFEDRTPLMCKDISSQTSEVFDPFLSMENQSNVPEDTCMKEINENICTELEESNNTSPRNSSDSAIPGTSFESMACRIPCLLKSDSEDTYLKNTEKADEYLEKTETPIKKPGKRGK